MKLAAKIIILFNVLFLAVAPTLAGQNSTDDNNKKQGHWVFTNKMKQLPGYKPDQIVEEGDYIDNKKTGKWTFYFNNGQIKHILTFVNNKPEGEAIFYYKNGKIREKGLWKNNHWVGSYSQYYSNGNIKSEFNYNAQGVKSGEQKFFHENGNLMITGTWINGEESGDTHEYNEDGTPNTERYKEGPSIVKTTKVEPLIEEVPDTTIDEREIVKKEKKKTVTPFDGNGYHEFKDRQGRNVRVGEFENGYLKTGKIFEYDSNGKLSVTKIVEDGKIIKIEENLSSSDKK